jgi:cholesterol transport system auxiliary component
MRTAALMLGALLAGGCTNLFHSDAKPEQTYVLRAAATAPAAAGTAAPVASAVPLADLGAIQVLHPVTAPGLDGPLIMLVQADHRMNFYVGSRWPAPLPDVVESLAVETLRAAGEWQSVQDSGSAFPVEYVLQISVRRFEADYTAGTNPQVTVVLDCTLGARQGRELVASYVAEASAPAASDRMREVVAAFERASGTALASLEAQTASATRAYAAHAGATH